MKNLLSFFGICVCFALSAQTTLTRDTSFGESGIFEVPFSFSGLKQLTLLPDGNMLAFSINTQTNESVILKINPDGFIDETFGNNGAITIFPIEEETIVYFLLQGQKIIVVYSGSYMGDGSDANAYRYNQDGSLDTFFGENGVLYGPLNVWNTKKPLLVLQDNSLLEIKYDRLVKYTEDGQRDLSYGNNGEMEIETVNNELLVPFSILGNLIYRSNAENTLARDFEFFDYKNPSERLFIDNQNESLFTNHSIFSIKLNSDKKTYGLTYYDNLDDGSLSTQTLFVLDEMFAFDSDFNENGLVTISVGDNNNYPWKDVEFTQNQYFIVGHGGFENPDFPMIESYDENGSKLTINNQESFFEESLGENISFNMILAGEDYIIVSTNNALVKYKISGKLNLSELNEKNLILYQDNGNVIISSKSDLSAVEIYNLQGQLIHKKQNINKESYSFNAEILTNQVLIIKSTLENGKIESRKFLVK